MSSRVKAQNQDQRLLPQQMQALLESTRLINSTLDLDHLLQIIVEVINRNLTADRSTLYLVDKAKKEIWSKVLLGDESLFIRQAIGKGISGYVAKTGEIINIPDAYKDSRFNPEVDRKSGYRTRSILCAPIIDKNGEIIGVIQTLNKKRGTFNANDIRFLQALAVNIAIAIENARLYQEALERKNLENEISLAGEINKYLLPQEIPKIAGYEIFAFHQPSKHIGGDYFDFFTFPDKMMFVLADVSGKGVPAALLMANLQAAFHTLCNETTGCVPLIKKINSHFNLFTAPDKYATLFIGKLIYKTNQLEYINCGHIPPILFNYSKNNIKISDLEKGGVPLGFMEDYDFQMGKVEIKPESFLIICSDGITEAMNYRGDMFGREGIIKFTQQHTNLPANKFGDRFLKKVFRFSQDGTYHDDITLQIFKRNAI